ncbi:MAG: thioether cross-link-forming SCIFF peptide maturase [Clostridiales bacterium]|jgi:uncharacterized protein|nr:thioether cross-link-forming SCIFF peptide maturase [Clostridiales bacterium]
MIHKFSINGVNLLLDVHTGSLYELDDATYGLVGKNGLKEGNGEDYLKLRTLIEEGQLYSRDDYDNNYPNYRNNTPVKALCLHIAHDCNLRCGYCFADKGEYGGARALMSFETAKKAIDFVVDHSAKRKNIEVDFFGGEPLMNFDVIRKTIKYAQTMGIINDKVFRFTLTTNGVLLDNKKMKYINENMSNLVLSLDGRREIHDKMRKTINGEGSYDVVVDKLVSAAKMRGERDYYVRGTFTRDNLDFAKDVKHLAGLGFKNISVEPVVGGQTSDYSLKHEDLPIIFDEYERLARDYVEDDYNFFHFMLTDEQPCAVKRIAGCGAGCEYIAVAPNGDIYPCHQFVGREEFFMGSVADGELNRNISRRFAEVNVYSKPKCTECWAKFYCSGGCHANAFAFSGELDGVYEIGCELQKKRIECMLYVKSRRE